MTIDVEKFIPSPLLEYGNGWSNLKNKVQVLVDYFINRIDGIRYLFEPARTPLWNEVSYLVGAYVTDEDTPRTIKNKIGDAIHIHKNLGSFTEVYKPIIDAITGGSCSIYTGSINYDQFRIGISRIGSPSLIGLDNPSAYTKPKGDVYIDCGMTLTGNMITSLRKELIQIKPIYFNLFLGYTTATGGLFTIGSSTIGGFDEIGTASPASTTFIVQLTL